MKLVIFGDTLTYPAKEGVSQHVLSLLLALSRFPNIIEPILILCDGGTLGKKTLEGLPWKTILVPHAIYYNFTAIEEILNNISPDILQSYSSYYARLIVSHYSIKYKVPLVMEHHDIDTEFASNYSNGDVKHTYQQDVSELASINRTLSFVDKKILQLLVPHKYNTFFNLPTIIEDSFEGLDTSHKQATHILFLGNGAYPPNQEAIRFICNRVAPTLPDCTFHIIGRMTDTISTGKNVIGYGVIDDLRPIIAKSAFGIVPLLHGSGLKTKVLSYLSGGLVVIGTTLAFNGYKSSPNLIESSIEDFSTTIKDQVINYNLGKSLIARQYFLKNYSQQNINKLLSAYGKIRYNAHITENNSKQIQYDSSMLPWLSEFRERNTSIVTRPTFINFR